MAKQKIAILDSTLRDGAQGEGISFSVQDKLQIVQALDELGIRYIEAGNPGSNPKDLEFFEKIRSIKLVNSEIVAFGSTRRKGIACQDDSNLQSLLDAETKTVVYFGKSWDFQVTDILHATLDENIAMIFETAEFLSSANRNVIFDSEHFFDAWVANPDYAMKTLHAAIDGGASILVLCDTKGGAMMDLIEKATTAVIKEFATTKTKNGKIIEIGIHTHNDCGLAVSNFLILSRTSERPATSLIKKLL